MTEPLAGYDVLFLRELADLLEVKTGDVLTVDGLREIADKIEVAVGDGHPNEGTDHGRRG